MSKGGSNSPRRRVKTTGDSRPNLLIFSEGEKTEIQYLNDWYKRNRGRVTIQFHDFHGTPRSLVEQAVEAKKKEEREERRGRGRAHSHYWCIFDRDEHPYIPEAFELAASNNIHTAYSNPCIEVWFMLHFQDQSAHIHRHDAQRKSNEYLNCNKSLSGSALAELAKIDKFEIAKSRAISLDSKHAGDGSPVASNPSSSIWKLMDLIRGEAK
ncbi:RloB family protein [Streptomyces diastatochromogenes]|nr:RloB family protein [Streptomyces diastatochromogenes]